MYSKAITKLDNTIKEKISLGLEKIYLKRISCSREIRNHLSKKTIELIVNL